MYVSMKRGVRSTMTGKTWQAVLTTVIILSIGIVSVGSLNAWGTSRRVFNVPGLLGDAGVERLSVETPGAAFSAWKERGFAGRTVLYVAGAWERLGNTYEAPVSRPYPLRLFRLTEIRQEDITSANVVYYANLNGIVRRALVILPEHELSNVSERARTSKEYHTDAGGLYYPYQGFTRWFTTGAGLKAETEPVLLYVSASYFRYGDPEQLYHELVRSGLATDCMILCRASGDDSVTAAEREKLAHFGELAGFPPEDGEPGHRIRKP